MTALAPAGAINSCAADMARWLLAQLGGGQLDGAAVMSPGTVARQHTPHMLMPEDRTFPASTQHGHPAGDRWAKLILTRPGAPPVAGTSAGQAEFLGEEGVAVDLRGGV